MASYHCSVKVLSRNAGRSAVQFSAYISAKELHDERLQETFRHKSKDEVVFTDFIFADRLSEDLRDPEKFWNAVEAVEKQANSQVCRTWEIALPHELTIEQNEELAREFAQSLLDDGMPAVQFSVHAKEGNWHAHFMAPMRDFQNGKWQGKEKKDYVLDGNGNRIPILDDHGQQKLDSRNRKQWKRKTIQANKWNDREFVHTWRKRVADLQNVYLERHGHETRVDHRSNKERGIALIPTVHEGYTARRMEEEGEIADRADLNRKIRARNSEIEKLIEADERQQFELEKKIEETQEEISNERYRQIMERTARSLNRTLNRNGEGERSTPTETGTGTATGINSDNSRAGAEDYGLAEVQRFIERKQREFDAAVRERIEAQKRQREIEERERAIEAERKRKRDEQERERERKQKTKKDDRGFSR